MTIIEQIKAEIERLKPKLRKVGGKDATMTTEQVRNKFNALLDFLSTLESEKPIPNDLEEAAKNYTDSSEWLIGENLEHIDAAFIAGAKWQKEQMMKEAVPFYEILKAVPPGPERDKVRIIIVKEEEK